MNDVRECKFCYSELLPQAKYCHHCGKIFQVQVAQEVARSLVKVLVCLLLLGIAGFFLLLGSCFFVMSQQHGGGDTTGSCVAFFAIGALFLYLGFRALA